MRELTKSTLSAGLAVSLLGMQTMMGLFRGRRPDGRNGTVEALDSVTQAMVDQSGDVLRETFQIGDKIQRQIIDMTFQFLTFAPLRSAGNGSTMGGVTQQATGWLRNWMGAMSNPCGPCSGRTRASQPRTAAWSGPQQAADPSSRSAGQGWGPLPNPTTDARQGPRPSGASPMDGPAQGWGPIPDRT
jgi:hypothetical protein